ncbi:hypothetical protein BCR34DRAFT_608849 [Clohesyomyces aquaticus]|uniref:Uncharacterized protein n=1 Tax=Clohesyomyces aquaticus TaxID=1231657 RepID=A0A1Y1Y2Q0_9PLEO|nr:hypothetical protein BCR34DRAFT_608849 [Clohesyomyces aquaticus]
MPKHLLCRWVRDPKAAKPMPASNLTRLGPKEAIPKMEVREIAPRLIVPSSGKNVSKDNTKANGDTNTEPVKGTENIKRDQGTKNTKDIDSRKTLIKTKTPAPTKQGFALARAPTIQLEDPLGKTTSHTDDAPSSNTVIQSGYNNKLFETS